MLGEKFKRAVGFAIDAHQGQVCKGSRVPYVSHPLHVAAIALEHGAGEDEAIAALLHDVLEDTSTTWERIAREFGERIAEIVRVCSNTEDPDDKGEWKERKDRYLKHLRNADASAALVSCADKLHNAGRILRDYRQLGEDLWSRFRAGRAGQLWYYRALVTAFQQTEAPTNLVEDLERTVSTVEALVRKNDAVKTSDGP